MEIKQCPQCGSNNVVIELIPRTHKAKNKCQTCEYEWIHKEKKTRQTQLY